MKIGTIHKLFLIVCLLTVLAGCNNANQEIKQEQREDIIDEREDEQLDTPAQEYRKEQMEDRMDEMEDRR
ncbi:MAG: hypothetical protein ACQEXQ_20190 [Bacillota bacterium]